MGAIIEIVNMVERQVHGTKHPKQKQHQQQQNITKNNWFIIPSGGHVSFPSPFFQFAAHTLTHTHTYLHTQKGTQVIKNVSHWKYSSSFNLKELLNHINYTFGTEKTHRRSPRYHIEYIKITIEHVDESLVYTTMFQSISSGIFAAKCIRKTNIPITYTTYIYSTKNTIFNVIGSDLICNVPVMCCRVTSRNFNKNNNKSSVLRATFRPHRYHSIGTYVPIYMAHMYLELPLLFCILF